MGVGRLPLMTALRMAYADTGAALRAMPNIAITACGILIATSAFSILVVQPMIAPESLLGRDIVGLANNFLLTPLLIAVHRFIILNEVTTRYVVEPRDPRFALFFYWSAALFILTAGSGALAVLLISNDGLRIVLEWVLSLAMLIVSLRMTLLFPAIAVDAQGATWSNAWRDTQGHTAYLFALVMMALLPLALVISILVGLRPAFGPLGGAVVALIPGSAGMVVTLVLLVAIASRFFLTVGERVKQGPDAGGAPGADPT